MLREVVRDRSRREVDGRLSVEDVAPAERELQVTGFRPEIDFRSHAAEGPGLHEAGRGDAPLFESVEEAEESRARVLPGADTPTFDRWAFRPVSELFAHCELSPRAQAVIDHWSGLYAGAPARTAVAMHAGIIDHYMRGAYYPEGGGQMIAARGETRHQENVTQAKAAVAPATIHALRPLARRSDWLNRRRTRASWENARPHSGHGPSGRPNRSYWHCGHMRSDPWQ